MCVDKMFFGKLRFQLHHGIALLTHLAGYNRTLYCLSMATAAAVVKRMLGCSSCLDARYTTPPATSTPPRSPPAYSPPTVREVRYCHSLAQNPPRVFHLVQTESIKILLTAHKGLNNPIPCSFLLHPHPPPPLSPRRARAPASRAVPTLTPAQRTDARWPHASPLHFFQVLIKVPSPVWTPSLTFLVNSNFLTLFSFLLWCRAPRSMLCPSSVEVSFLRIRM